MHTGFVQMWTLALTYLLSDICAINRYVMVSYIHMYMHLREYDIIC